MLLIKAPTAFFRILLDKWEKLVDNDAYRPKETLFKILFIIAKCEGEKLQA
jgi:hypothetical protein